MKRYCLVFICNHEIKDSSHIFFLLGLGWADEQAPKVLSLPIQRNAEVHQRSLTPRAGTPVEQLGNYVQLSLYGINVTIGTPGQQVAVQLDTGSTDFWVYSPEGCKEAGCQGGSFNVNDSSTAYVQDANGFNIQYGTAGSFVKGDYISDTIQLQDITVKKMNMAVAYSAKNERTGILGVGFDVNEALVTNQHEKPYANFIDLLVSEKVINTSGQILFGGYDTDKYTGELYGLDIQPDANTNTISTMTVALTSLGLETSHEVQYLSLSGNNAVPVLLDSGTTLLQVPSDVFEEFAEVTMLNGNKGCKFGVQEGDEWILGDTFLRSAYVVYDLDEEKIWLARTKYNSTSSNMVEIGVERVAAPPSPLPPRGLLEEVETGAPSFSLPASATATLTGGLGQATSATGTASGTATGSTSSPSASGSSAASSTQMDKLSFMPAALVAVIGLLM
ncbi:aspartic peptidase domain-containing protein [Talaromyces proteolyticus]|uniref:Aspartic peptidase domain-containing protein n=1 Tax=Talaromyces proteolyticus TaxID=1131652 RepID=A0AAD4KHJ9_9EURO|nr:aspartic peptidase domain-containing protein [Talaromyces proteolyticus]KAH8689574.1 aspartic peptidase domain-containing protein [Talaromyces proteolyticus]